MLFPVAVGRTLTSVNGRLAEGKIKSYDTTSGKVTVIFPNGRRAILHRTSCRMKILRGSRERQSEPLGWDHLALSKPDAMRKVEKTALISRDSQRPLLIHANSG